MIACARLQQQHQRRVRDVLAGGAPVHVGRTGAIDLAHALPQHLHQRNGGRGIGSGRRGDARRCRSRRARPPPTPFRAAVEGITPAAADARASATSNSSIAWITPASEKTSASAPVVARQSIRLELSEFVAQRPSSRLLHVATTRRIISSRLPSVSQIEEDGLVVSLQPDDELPRSPGSSSRPACASRVVPPVGGHEREDRVGRQLRVAGEIDARVELPQQTARQHAHVDVRRLSGRSLEPRRA